VEGGRLGGVGIEEWERVRDGKGEILDVVVGRKFGSRWAFSYWMGISLPGMGVRIRFNKLSFH
jgi:hypothetical protein